MTPPRERLPDRRFNKSFAREIRKALCRDSAGRALGPVAAALDIIAKNGGPT